MLLQMGIWAGCVRRLASLSLLCVCVRVRERQRVCADCNGSGLIPCQVLAKVCNLHHC